jgi:hypothetical protein
VNAKPKLRVVGEQPVDITAALRAEIEARDWSKVHVTGDRSAPIFLPDRLRRIWR